MRFLTAGESHGKALVGILEGIPAGLNIKIEDIQEELVRRKKGYGRGDRQKIETDTVQILSGIRFGKTLGSPISLVIENKDWKNWEKIMSARAEDQNSDRKVEIPRPGHADLTGAQKYGFEDMRNVLERASARETTMRVAIGSIARVFLKECGIVVYSRVTQIGNAQDSTNVEWSESLFEKIEASPVRMACLESESRAVEEIKKAGEAGDTLGGTFEVVAVGVPLGLGSYVHWDRKLDGKLAQCLMSLNAIKSVDLGIGHKVAKLRGSEVHDEIIMKDKGVGYASNRSGGVQAGMSSGEALVLRAHMKPISTLKSPLQSVNMTTLEALPAHFERSDVCAVPSAAVIGESLVALTLAEEILIKFGGDSMEELLPRILQWKEKQTR